MPLTLSSAKSANLLLDTGSDITVLKLQCADLDAFINTNHTLRLKGITSEVTSTLGVCQGTFQLNNKFQISHPVHLVPNDFPISCDGILGKDFLIQNKAVINYKNSLLVLKLQEEVFPFHIKNPDTITVPARSEFYAKIPVDGNAPRVCLQKELSEGLIVGNSIINPQNGI